MPAIFYRVKAHVMAAANWLDTHPRTAWYVTALLLLNTILHIIQFVS